MAQISLKDISKTYKGDIKAVDNFNLEIKPGQRLALIGPSGAGKATVAKILLRMHDLTRGEILIDGQNIAKVTHFRR